MGLSHSNISSQAELCAQWRFLFQGDGIIRMDRTDGPSSFTLYETMAQAEVSEYLLSAVLSGLGPSGSGTGVKILVNLSDGNIYYAANSSGCYTNTAVRELATMQLLGFGLMGIAGLR
jgi:hypothetical protein